MWIVSLFDRTGIMVKPWVEAGYNAVCVDIQNESPDSIMRTGDLKTWVPERRMIEDGVAFLAAFPPCDHLSVSGARWFKGKGLGALAESIILFERAAFWAEWFGAPYMIENPVSTISTYWRKPDHNFHPWEYAGLDASDNYTKKTCLWTGNGFVMPSRKPGNTAPDDRIHKAPPSPERKNIRSATPAGFARAVFETNHPSS